MTITTPELDKLSWYALNDAGEVLHCVLPTTPAIYIYKNKVESQYTYIGSAVNLRRRIARHRYDFQKGVRACPFFYQALREQGWQHFEFAILEMVVVKTHILQREQYYLDVLLPYYNVCRIVWSERGSLRWPQDARIEYAKLFAVRRAHPQYKIFREKMRQSRLGKTVSEETREKMRQAKLGKKRGAYKKTELRRKAQQETPKGWRLSPEGREKIRQANLGKIVSPETREKLRQARLGKPLWPEVREKIRQSKLKKK